MKRCRRASSAVQDRHQSPTMPPPRLRLSRCCSEPPTRTANRCVGRHVLTRLAHRLDASEAALEEERHEQVVGERASPVRVPRAAAAAPGPRGAAAGARSTEEAARSAPVEIVTPLTHLRRQFARAYHWSRCRSRLSWEHLKHQHLLESTASKRAVIRASTVTVKSAREYQQPT